MPRRSMSCILWLIGLSWAVSPDTAFQRWAGIPVIAYTEETGWQLGVLGIVFFKPDMGVPYGDQVDAAVIRTTRGQTRATVVSVNWLNGGMWRVRHEVNYRDWPGVYSGVGNRLYSIPPQEYDMSLLGWNGRVEANLRSWFVVPRWADEVRVGGEYDLEWNHARFDSASSYTAALRRGGRRVGLGWLLLWDSRDHDHAPRRGFYANWRQVYYKPGLGSAWDFTNSKADLRAYFPLPLESALGLASYWEGVRGDVPFDRLAMPDGVYQMRGLEKGILRDRQQWVLQSEMRVPLFWRLGAVAFAEAGKVGPYFSALWHERFHRVWGLGLRVAMNPARRVNVRADFSWVDGDPGLTLYYKEAF